MKLHKTSNVLQRAKELGFLVPVTAMALALSACGGGGGADNPTSYSSDKPFQVGVNAYDGALPAEPQLPTDAQVCATLYAGDTTASNAVRLVSRPDGALPPEADPSPSGVGPQQADAVTTNPDQKRIQDALNACGAAVDAEVGAKIAADDAAAVTAQKAVNKQVTVRTVANDGTVSYKQMAENIAGLSGEALTDPKYKASKFAVRLVVSKTGPQNAFISGPLVLPSGVTLWIDKGVTLYASRDVMLYSTPPSGTSPATMAGKTGPLYCGNTAVQGGSGSSGNCSSLISGANMVNSAIMGDGRIDSRAYAELVTTNKLYPLLKVDGTCTNTYAAYAKGLQAVEGSTTADGTPLMTTASQVAVQPGGGALACDNGGTFVSASSAARNMTWWDLAWKGNMVDNGLTGVGSQSNFRMMYFQYAKNLTLYRITLSNSANFHVVPYGIDGLTIWGVKVQTPSLAAFANPAGNGNPLYTGFTWNEDNVKNTDAFDPGSMGKVLAGGALTTGFKLGATAGATGTVVSSTTSNKIYFDAYLKNFLFAYNFVSTGDDDMALKGSNNPTPGSGALAGGVGNGLFAIDGNRDVRSDRKWGIIVAHNHIYWGHGISVGSESNAGVTNAQVYDNTFEGSEEGLRIKSDYGRGGEVSNMNYSNICIKGTLNALLFTPYYSTKAMAAQPQVPNFHDISITNLRIVDASNVKLQGFAAGTGGVFAYGNGTKYSLAQFPLGMKLTNVVADSPKSITMSAISDANLTLSGVNLPIFADPSNNVKVSGLASQAVDPNKVIDCSKAFVDFPAIGESNLFGSSWASGSRYRAADDTAGWEKDTQ